MAASKNSSRRLVKVTSMDFNLDDFRSVDLTLCSSFFLRIYRVGIKVSPILFLNITGNKNSMTSCQISITPTPFGPRAPTIPTAKAATIARVASPLVNDHLMESSIFQALKMYFVRHKRLLKKGDMIAVHVDQNSPILPEEYINSTRKQRLTYDTDLPYK